MVPVRCGSRSVLLLREDILRCQGRKRFHRGKKSLEQREPAPFILQVSTAFNHFSQFRTGCSDLRFLFTNSSTKCGDPV